MFGTPLSHSHPFLISLTFFQLVPIKYIQKCYTLYTNSEITENITNIAASSAVDRDLTPPWTFITRKGLLDGCEMVTETEVDESASRRGRQRDLVEGIQTFGGIINKP